MSRKQRTPAETRTSPWKKLKKKWGRRVAKVKWAKSQDHGANQTIDTDGAAEIAAAAVRACDPSTSMVSKELWTIPVSRAADADGGDARQFNIDVLVVGDQAGPDFDPDPATTDVSRVEWNALSDAVGELEVRMVYGRPTLFTVEGKRVRGQGTPEHKGRRLYAEPAVADQAADFRPPLRPDDLLILQALDKSPTTMTQTALEDATRRTRKYIGARLKHLLAAGFVHYPAGPRGGVTMTPAGRKIVQEGNTPVTH